MPTNNQSNCFKQENVNCKNFIIRAIQLGDNKGQHFIGCKLYPNCKMMIPLKLESGDITINQNKLIHNFNLFVSSNSFLAATYSYIYFNLKDPALLDYLLRTELIKDGPEAVEVGCTKAKIYYTLYYHLYILPVAPLQVYLKANFPISHQRYLDNEKSSLFSFIDYKSNKVKEYEILSYI